MRAFEDLFPGYNQAVVRLTQLSPQPMGVRLVELAYLAYLAALWDSPNIFEFGTGLGRTTLNLCLNIRGSPRVWTLDVDGRVKPEDCKKAFAEFQRSEVFAYEHGRLLDQHPDVCSRVVRLFGNSLEVDFSPYYATMNLIFVDGGHTVDAVLSDSRNALKMLRPEGGVIVWHDYCSADCPDVVHAVNQLAEHNTIYQVRGTRMAIHLRGETAR